MHLDTPLKFRKIRFEGAYLDANGRILLHTHKIFVGPLEARKIEFLADFQAFFGAIFFDSHGLVQAGLEASLLAV